LSDDIDYVTVDEVLDLHDVVVEHAKEYAEKEGKDFSKQHYGLRRDQRGSLESAVARPQTDVFGYEKYPSLAEKVAVLAQSLTQNHCFINGNKRTALVAAVSFLAKNGYELVTTDLQADNLNNFWLRMAEAIEALFISSPEFVELVATHIYVAGFKGLAEFLLDPDDDEITWGESVHSREKFEAPWDHSRKGLAFKFSDSEMGLRGNLTEGSRKQYDYIIARGLIELTNRIIIEVDDGDTVYFVPEIEERLQDMPEDEAAVARATMVRATYVGAVDRVAPNRRVPEILQDAEKTFGGDLDESKRDRYEEIVESIQGRDELPDGMDVTLTVDDGEEYEAEFILEVYPLHVFPEKDSAHFPMAVHICFPDGAPDFDEFSEEDLTGLSEEVLEAFSEMNDETFEAILGLSEQVLAMVLEPEDDDDTHPADFNAGYSLDAPPIVSTGSYEPMWKFILRIKEEELTVEEIADWFRDRMRPLPK